jgi:hypothetical protein
VDDQLYIEKVTPESELYCRIAGVTAEVKNPLESCLAKPATKLVAISDPRRIERLLPDLSEEFAQTLYVTQSIPEFVELANPAISKGRALHLVAERLGIPRHAVMAFGDGLNDLEMLREAGWGVAMGQAPSALREAADEVTLSIDEDGVAGIVHDDVGRLDVAVDEPGCVQGCERVGHLRKHLERRSTVVARSPGVERFTIDVLGGDPRVAVGDAVAHKACDAGQATFTERGKLVPVALRKPGSRVLHDLERDGEPVGLPGRQPRGALSAGAKPAHPW